jgi:hypothetical protein
VRGPQNTSLFPAFCGWPPEQTARTLRPTGVFWLSWARLRGESAQGTARAISPRSEGTSTDSATQQRSALVLTVDPGALLGLILSQVGADWRRRC